jgi:Domain of unknown function (DUF4112)
MNKAESRGNRMAGKDDAWTDKNPDSPRLPNGKTVEEELRGLRTMARWLDSKFEVFGVRFGLDAIVGLIPVAGDGATLIAGGAALIHAIRLGLPWHVSLRIIINLLIDAGLGSIPIIGDLFDFFFRSHKRNFRLVERHVLKRAASASSLPAPKR